jgi:glycosyltransferase involved in cell wall biosynthesis
MSDVDLTVILPNYNHARFLPRALDAILSQSARPREVIAVDDASTDGSLRVLDGYARKYPLVQVVRHDANRGAVAALNTGLRLAAARYVYLGAADDYVLPGFFEKTCSLFDRHPDAGLCSAYGSYRVGDGPVEANPSGWSDAPGFLTPDELADRLRHNIPGHCSIVRREPLLKICGLDPVMGWYSDWLANLTVAFRHGACHVPETLAVRVLMPENYSAAAGEQGERHVVVLGAFLDRIMSSAYADVAPYFRRNGAPTYFGPDLLRAAAGRPDRWSPEVLGFLNGFTREQYTGLLADPDPAVRELAEFFLGPFWRRHAEREEQQKNEAIHLRNLLEQARSQIPPPGAVGKLRWLARLAARRVAVR